MASDRDRFDEYSGAKNDANKFKNRILNALPCNEPYNETIVYTAYIYNTDDNRVKLTKMPGVIGSDYINASYIDV